MIQGNDNDLLTRIGETFGDQLASVIGTNRLTAVTVHSVDEEFAYVTMYEGDTPLPVPLSGNGLAGGFFKFTPNVGSISTIAFMDGDENTPFFVSHSEIDKVEFKRGETSVTWQITPPGRDGEGEPTMTETEDILSIAVGDASIQITKDNIYMEVGGSTLSVDPETIQANGGSLGGLIVIGKLTDRLNKLQSEVQTFVSTYNTHTHPFIGVAPGTAAVTTPTASAAQPPTRFSVSEYENEKVKQ